MKVIAAGDEVPITKYATQLVDNLAKEPGYPADFAARYQANIVSKEDNVKAVVAKLELGEGDAAIVYVTDAEASDRGRHHRCARSPRTSSRRTPASSSRPSTHAEAADAFLTWFAGAEGQAILERLRVPPADQVTEQRRRVTAGHAAAPASPGSLGRSDRSRPVAVLFALFLGLPVLTLVGRAVLTGSLQVALATPAVLDALWLSLVTTSISLVITVVLGLPLAFVLARRAFRGKGLIETVVDLPIVLPPSVAGLALLLVFGRRGLLSAPFNVLGISVPFTTIAVILAMVFVSAPFFIRSARNGIAGVDRDLEDAARVDGATERQLFRSVTLPLAGRRPGGRPRDDLGSVAGRVRRDDHVRRQRPGPDADAATGRLQRVPGRRPGRLGGRGGDPRPGRVRRADRGPGVPLGPSRRRPRAGLIASGCTSLDSGPRNTSPLVISNLVHARPLGRGRQDQRHTGIEADRVPRSGENHPGFRCGERTSSSRSTFHDATNPSSKRR